MPFRSLEHVAVDILGFALSVTLIGAQSHSLVKIRRSAHGFELTRNGTPYFVNGAGGGSHLDVLKNAGGNSIRAWATSREALDRAHHRGLTVLLGLPIGKPRHGFDYRDRSQVEEQFQKVYEIVVALKDHPALLMWALGNESELATSEENRILIWKELNRIAEMVKKTDPNHPVITVIAGAGGRKLRELDEHCPALDAIGINAYGSMMKLPEAIAEQGWKRPYLVTEFGPRGHWEVDKTPWGLPLEDSSAAKADFYLRAYRHAIQDRPTCLGSYVFLWGNKQEKTHTWYGVFLPDGSRTGAVDSMSYAWTGKWPANRCPRIGSIRIQLATPDSDEARWRAVPAGASLDFTVAADDPDGDPLTVKWDLRPDVSDAPQRGGDREEPAPLLSSGAVSQPDHVGRVRLPQEPGNYRLFVYAYDKHGNAATANLPIRAEVADTKQ